MLSDPIAALATPAGRSALAVIRLSGDGAFTVAERVIEGFRTDRPRTALLATFRSLTGEALDRGLYTLFPRPHSYTGEDMVELSCHGGLLAPARLLAALHAAGSRPAAPGEFTRRAVLNGKLDLVQAEAVGDMIDAVAPAQARAALHQLDGGLSHRLAELRESLIESRRCSVTTSISLGKTTGRYRRADRRAARGCTVRIERLIAGAPSGERLREGALLVLAGRPNAGKSSLFNALLGIDRALVTEIPGTTRDAIEAHTDFLGWPVRLVDTAGLGMRRPDRPDGCRGEPPLPGAPPISWCSVSRRDANRAPTSSRSLAARPTILARTKADLDPAAGERAGGVGGDWRGLGSAPRRGGAGVRRADYLRRSGARPDPRAAPRPH